MFEDLLLPWQQIYHLAFKIILGTAAEVSSKFYFVQINQVSEKLWLFNHKELPNFGFFSLLSLLNSNKTGLFYMFRFGGPMSPSIIFVVCGPITTKFCTGIENQIISSNMQKIAQN